MRWLWNNPQSGQNLYKMFEGIVTPNGKDENGNLIYYDISRKIEQGASLPAERIAAVERLADAGLDVQVRLSPYIPELVNVDELNAIRCDKILVEFLRVNTWIARWIRQTGLPVDLRQYRYKSAGYRHLPLRVKRDLLRKITGFREVSVCSQKSDIYQLGENAIKVR